MSKQKQDHSFNYEWPFLYALFRCNMRFSREIVSTKILMQLLDEVSCCWARSVQDIGGKANKVRSALSEPTTTGVNSEGKFQHRPFPVREVLL